MKTTINDVKRRLSDGESAEHIADNNLTLRLLKSSQLRAILNGLDDQDARRELSEYTNGGATDIVPKAATLKLIEFIRNN